MSAIYVLLGLTIVTTVVSRWVKELRFVAVIFIGITAGLGWFHVYNNIYLQSARELDGQTVKYEVIVRDYSYDTDFGAAVDGEIFVDGRSYQVRVYLDGDYHVEPGNRLVGKFRFRFTSTDGSEEVVYHRSQGIFLLAYQEGNVVVERFWSEPLIGKVPQWRSKLLDVIDEIFPEDVSGFCKALLLGDSDELDYETSTAFTLCGIRHVVAVSGLHVSMLFGLIYLLSARKRVLTAIIGIPVLVLFSALVGFTPSVVRASILQILMMLAMLFEREYDQPTALSFAALVMQVVNPLVVASVSLQLSFGCMTGIAMLSQRIKEWLLDKKRLGHFASRWAKPLASSLAVSLSAMVFTTPLVAIHFGVVSLISVVSNLLILWMITLAFYGILLSCLVGSIATTAGVWLGSIFAWTVRYILGISKVLAAFPLAAVYTQSGFIVAWLVFAYVLLGIYILSTKKPAGLFAALMTISLGVCLLCSWMEPLLDSCRVTMLDVGQGQAILLQSSGKTYLVDCGGDYDEEAADITAETLLSQGICRLDGVILTHYDRDHSGGMQYLLTRIGTELLIMPALEDENLVAQNLPGLTDGAVMILDEDIQITYEDTILTIFAPEHDNLGNEGSICVLFQAGNSDILITSDRGIAGERILLHEHVLPKVDLLVVGHHGSKNSTSQELLDAIEPTYAFISVGEDNFYGHPAQELLKRLLDMGCVIYRTDEDGTIVYRG